MFCLYILPEFYDECKIHGRAAHAISARAGGREVKVCKKCRSEAVSKSRQIKKQRLFALHGDACRGCHYQKESSHLSFHHLDPEQKSFELSGAGLTKNWKSILAEAAKCIVLCGNCHGEVNGGVRDVSHLGPLADAEGNTLHPESSAT